MDNRSNANQGEVKKWFVIQKPNVLYQLSQEAVDVDNVAKIAITKKQSSFTTPTQYIVSVHTFSISYTL